MRLLAVLPSTQLTKKLMAVFRDDDGKNKTVHFGSSYHLDFIKYSALSPTLALKKKPVTFLVTAPLKIGVTQQLQAPSPAICCGRNRR